MSCAILAAEPCAGNRGVDQDLALQRRLDLLQCVGLRSERHGQHDDGGGLRGGQVVGAANAALAVAFLDHGADFGGGGFGLLGSTRSDDHVAAGQREAASQSVAEVAGSAQHCDGALLFRHDSCSW
jgi:hypothetical protein